MLLLGATVLMSATSLHTPHCSQLVAPGGVSVPCLDIPECDKGAVVVNNFTVMAGGADNGPATYPPVKAEQTTASVCWSARGVQVNWSATDKNVVYNCSGTSERCCHDQVWMHDALEFYMSAGLNASWNGHYHNVTEADGGPKGGLWVGFINNSGYQPTQPSRLVSCTTPGLSWSPTVTDDGFTAQLRVPWSLLPGAATGVQGLRGSVWRLNFYRWDHGLEGGGGNASAWSVTWCDRQSGHATGGCNGEHVPKYFGLGLLV
jgi:hypothetical protein|eukprot:COSAG02_NODE_16309_length_1094_cov_0.869347_1_plen_261_part_00